MPTDVTRPPKPQRDYSTLQELIDDEKHGARLDDVIEPEKVAQPRAPPAQVAHPVIDLSALPRTYLLDEAQAARALNVARGTLSVWRSTGRWNLRFTKIGRSVRYRVGDLLDFIERRTRSNGATE